MSQNKNVPAEGVPYFTPAQNPPAGTAVDPQPDGRPIPTLFQPIRIRGVTFQNRIWVGETSCVGRYLGANSSSFPRFANTRPRMAK